MPDTGMSVEELVEQLRRATVTPELARKRPVHGGVPAAAGLYAWWSQTDAIGELLLAQVPGSSLRLLYIASSPVRTGSVQTLRGRICGSDLRGGPADSPLRRTLCSLLWQDQGWELGHRGKRIILTQESQAALVEWQATNLKVSWVTMSKPWLARPAVAKTLGAPLNLAEDRNHRYHWLVSEARQRLRSAALTAAR